MRSVVHVIGDCKLYPLAFKRRYEVVTILVALFFICLVFMLILLGPCSIVQINSPYVLDWLDQVAQS